MFGLATKKDLEALNNRLQASLGELRVEAENGHAATSAEVSLVEEHLNDLSGKIDSMDAGLGAVLDHISEQVDLVERRLTSQLIGINTKLALLTQQPAPVPTPDPEPEPLPLPDPSASVLLIDNEQLARAGVATDMGHTEPDTDPSYVKFVKTAPNVGVSSARFWRPFDRFDAKSFDISFWVKPGELFHKVLFFRDVAGAGGIHPTNHTCIIHDDNNGLLRAALETQFSDPSIPHTMVVADVPLTPGEPALLTYEFDVLATGKWQVAIRVGGALTPLVVSWKPTGEMFFDNLDLGYPDAFPLTGIMIDPTEKKMGSWSLGTVSVRAWK